MVSEDTKEGCASWLTNQAIAKFRVRLKVLAMFGHGRSESRSARLLAVARTVVGLGVTLDVESCRLVKLVHS